MHRISPLSGGMPHSGRGIASFSRNFLTITGLAPLQGGWGIDPN